MDKIQEIYDALTKDHYTNRQEIKLREQQNEALTLLKSSLSEVLTGQTSLRYAKAELTLRWVKYDEDDNKVKANIILSVLDQL